MRRRGGCEEAQTAHGVPSTETTSADANDRRSGDGTNGRGGGIRTRDPLHPMHCSWSPMGRRGTVELLVDQRLTKENRSQPDSRKPTKSRSRFTPPFTPGQPNDPIPQVW